MSSTRGGGAAAPNPDALRRLGFFREFTPLELRRVALMGVMQTYGRGEVLATEGTRKQHRMLYLVLRGELQYVKRIRGERAAVVLTLRPGDVGGFLTFFTDNPSPVCVRSVERSTIFEIGRREFQALIGDQPGLAIKMLVALVRATALRLDALLGKVAAASAWTLDLEQHLRTLPLAPEG